MVVHVGVELIQNRDAAVEVGGEGAPEDIGEKHPEGGSGDFASFND